MLVRNMILLAALLFIPLCLSCSDDKRESTAEKTPSTTPPEDIKTIRNLSLNRIPESESITRFDESITITEYIPLDRGNEWTYKIEESGDGSERVVNTVYAVTDGWSMFESFFGKKNIGLKISTAGEIYINNEGGFGTFYNNNTVTGYPETTFKTPAGDFDDVVVFTTPDTEGFWFMDVYAKGVGLIYHHQKSPAGEIVYTLQSASVRGRTYPKKN